MDQKTQVRKALLEQLVKVIHKSDKPVSVEVETEDEGEDKEMPKGESKGKKCPTCGHCSE